MAHTGSFFAKVETSELFFCLTHGNILDSAHDVFVGHGREFHLTIGSGPLADLHFIISNSFTVKFYHSAWKKTNTEYGIFEKLAPRAGREASAAATAFSRSSLGSTQVFKVSWSMRLQAIIQDDCPL
jgi:hypothetical protein